MIIKRNIKLKPTDEDMEIIERIAQKLYRNGEKRMQKIKEDIEHRFTFGVSRKIYCEIHTDEMGVEGLYVSINPHLM